LQKTAFSTVGFSQRSFTDAGETPNLLEVRFCFPYNVVKTRRLLPTTFGVYRKFGTSGVFDLSSTTLIRCIDRCGHASRPRKGPWLVADERV